MHRQGVVEQNKGKKVASKGNTGEQVTAMARGPSWAGSKGCRWNPLHQEAPVELVLIHRLTEGCPEDISSWTISAL